MGKNPSFPWYPNDFDRDLGKCTTSTAGIWTRCLNQMWYEKPRGKLSMPRGSYLVLCRCSNEQFQQFLDENSLFSFADVTENNGIVTVVNRRMSREEKERGQARIRAGRHRNKEPVTETSRESNGEVTPPPSSSSSSSCSKEHKYKGEFENWYESWPRKGDKVDGQKAYVARIAEGFDPEQLIKARDNYLERCRLEGTGTKYIKLAKTFLGPGGHVDEALNPPAGYIAKEEEKPELPVDDLDRTMVPLDGKNYTQKQIDDMIAVDKVVRTQGGYRLTTADERKRALELKEQARQIASARSV